MNQHTQTQTRNQNGDYGLLPIELWNKIYDFKHAIEEEEYKQSKKAYQELMEYRQENDMRLFRAIIYRNYADFFSLKNIRDVIKNGYKRGEFDYFWNTILQGSDEDKIKIDKWINQKRPRRTSHEQFEYIMLEYYSHYYQFLRHDPQACKAFNDAIMAIYDCKPFDIAVWHDVHEYFDNISRIQALTPKTKIYIEAKALPLLRSSEY